MTDERDPQLAAVFAAVDEDLPDNGFVDGVMAGVERQARRAFVTRIGVAVAIVLCAFVVAGPLQSLIVAAMQGLMSPLIEFRHSLPAQILLPVNNVAVPLALVLLVLHLLRRRLFS